MTREHAIEQIEKEFTTADRALAAGNEGMARVCARRVAGIAIAFWLEQSPDKSWGIDAMSRLRHLHMELSVPADVRDAARNLTAKVTGQFSSSPPADAISDSRVIVNHLLHRTPSQERS